MPLGTPSYLIYLAVFAVAAAGCLAGAWWAYRRVSLPGVRLGLTSLLSASGIWALCHVGVLLSPGLGLKVAFYEAGLVFGFGTVFAWLWLCSAYSGRALHRRVGVRWAALILFVAVTATKLTNPWHGLYFSAELSAVPFRHLEVNHHVIYWLTAGLSYALAAVGFFMLSEPLRRAQVGGGKLAGLFALTALPLGANAVGYATPYLLDLSHEPIGVAAFALGALALRGNPSSGSQKESCLEEASRAGREARPSLVLSADGRIRNYNRAAAELIPALRGGTSRGETSPEGTPQEEIAGRHLEEALPRLARALEVETMDREEGPDGEGPDREGPDREGPDREGTGGDMSVEDMLDEGPQQKETLEVKGSGGESRYYRPVESQAGPGAGRLVVLQDVTERVLRRREEALELWAGMEIGDRRRLEGTYRRKDGSAFPVEVDIRRLRMQGKGQFMAISRDITDRKVAGRKLQRERDRLETLFESLPSPIVRCRAEGGRATVEEANPAFAETFPVGREEAEGQDLNDLLVPAGQKDAAAEIDRRAVEEGPVEHQVRRVAAGWEVRDFQLQVAGRQPEEGPPEIYAIYTDITDRKRRERRLQRAEALFQNAQDALFIVDVESGEASDGGASGSRDGAARERGEAPGEGGLSFSVRRVNPAFEEKTGLESEDLRGQDPKEVFGAEVGAEIEEKYRECIRRGEPMEYEEEVPIGGETTYWTTRIAPVVASGETQMIIGTARNVTEDRRREETLRAAKEEAEEAKEEAEQAKEEAEEASRLKSALLANMSHEIRTPLTSIIGFAEVLGREAAGLELTEESPLPGYASTIERSGKRLLLTLNGVLNLSKLQAGQMEMEAGPVDLAQQARLAAEELRPEAEEKEIGLELETGGGPAALAEAEIVAKADEGGVQIVLRNLLSNAIKYTDEGGVTVRTYREDGDQEDGDQKDGDQEDGNPQEDSWAVLEVEDTGIGMDPSVAEGLFEPFRQASEGLSREYEGTGIGLAVTREAVAQMGGSIEVETEKGAGTCMTVRLPLAGETEAA
ncbi:PAS domain-containing protein [Salinibacter ruber]|uniref:histidine kinase n=2 Tax=Salinibacter ruber TaxID=146919 RepID=A0A9X2V7P5_9BACT|nr:PAS domain-containing protein [Salinibacter ruber]MCS3639192.1 PAS domain S-box-containing protein [Salinibacter ruber]MCS4122253.1 PAS domain S-box-containing protein [Salinibacter ruber]